MSFAHKINGINPGKAIIIGICVGGFYWAVMYDDGSSLQRQIKNFNNQIRQAKVELESLKQVEEDARRYKAIISKQGQRLKEITKYIPEQLSDVDLMGLLSNEAKAAGANISNISSAQSARRNPLEQGSEKVFEEVAVKVELEGTYTQILMFLSFITKVDKVITVQDLSIKKASKNVQEAEDVGVPIVFGATFIGYRYLENKEGV